MRYAFNLIKIGVPFIIVLCSIAFAEDPTSDYWLNAAKNLSHENDSYDLALRCIEKYIDINASFSDAFRLKGDVLHKTEQYPKALESFDKSIDCNPLDYRPWKLKGDCLYDSKRFAEASDCYSNAFECLEYEYEHVKYNRTGRSNIISDLQLRRGDCLIRMKRYKDGIGCYDSIMNSKYNVNDALMKRGIALLQMGKENNSDDPSEFPRALDDFKACLRNRSGIEGRQEVIPYIGITYWFMHNYTWAYNYFNESDLYRDNNKNEWYIYFCKYLALTEMNGRTIEAKWAFDNATEKANKFRGNKYASFRQQMEVYISKDLDFIKIRNISWW